MRFVHGSFVLSAAMAGALCLAVACGGGAPPPETAATQPTAAAEEKKPEEAKPEEAKPEEKKPEEAKPEEKKPEAKAWKDMGPDQKKEHMKSVVMPKLGALMKEFDPKEFAEVKCSTCHGEGAKEGKFEMPNPKLPKLDRTNGFAKHKKKHAKMLEFMMQKVTPAMAEALGTTPFDPATKTGFGCSGCHVVEGK